MEKPVPYLKGVSYDILQLFNRKFSNLNTKLLTSFHELIMNYIMNYRLNSFKLKLCLYSTMMLWGMLWGY